MGNAMCAGHGIRSRATGSVISATGKAMGSMEIARCMGERETVHGPLPFHQDSHCTQRIVITFTHLHQPVNGMHCAMDDGPRVSGSFQSDSLRS